MIVNVRASTQNFQTTEFSVIEEESLLEDEGSGKLVTSQSTKNILTERLFNVKQIQSDNVIDVKKQIWIVGKLIKKHDDKSIEERNRISEIEGNSLSSVSSKSMSKQYFTTIILEEVKILLVNCQKTFI